MSSSSSTRRCIKFSLEEIKAATNDFHHEHMLGIGREAMVYFAEIYIDSKKTPVAVKHLKNKRDNTKEFETEIQTLSKIQHPNIVSLIGYCIESGQKVLVYEYMEYGDLSYYLEKKSYVSLSWLQRLDLCLDVARGLQHLHTETDEFSKGIIHRYVKPKNILVSENWVAKISNFGMFKLSNAGKDESTMINDCKGTSSFFAPEYHNLGLVTSKIDVFSFGVVLFQVLCKKMPWDREGESYYFDENEDLGIWARKNIDAQIRQEISVDSLTLFTDIIGRILQGKPDKRPTMNDVVLDLEQVLLCQESENQPNELEGSFSPRRCHQFSFREINAATDQFDSSKILGQGGEAKVYFAEIYIGSNKTPVAVKHLNDSSTEFESEIHTLSKIQHPNLVSLIGYCDESGHKILVYEYMAKGCLSDYLKKKSSVSLSWLERLSICLGAARGLQHLHTETDEFPKGIIHRDVKPGNILVGENWVGKLSDFGMFKLSNAGQDKSLMTTNLKGTSGYYAPEYIRHRRITRKIDVYAFGVVLFQVLCRKMPWDREDESYYTDEDEDLGFWAQQNVDAQIQGEMLEESLMVFANIIGRSLQANPAKRPTMDGVVLDLQKALECQETENQAKQPEVSTSGFGGMASQVKVYTMEEMSKHNKRNNRWKYMDEKFHNVTPIVDDETLQYPIRDIYEYSADICDQEPGDSDEGF